MAPRLLGQRFIHQRGQPLGIGGRKPGTDMNFRRTLPEIHVCPTVCPAGYPPREAAATGTPVGANEGEDSPSHKRAGQPPNSLQGGAQSVARVAAAR